MRPHRAFVPIIQPEVELGGREAHHLLDVLRARVGDTLCLNPGSEAAFGILRGYLVDVGPDGVERWFRVEG